MNVDIKLICCLCFVVACFSVTTATERLNNDLIKALFQMSAGKQVFVLAIDPIDFIYMCSR